MNTLHHSLLAAAGVWLLGNGINALALVAFGPPAGETLLPAWAFAAVWQVLYPLLGIALVRATAGRWSLGLAIVVLLAWMPLACAAQAPLLTFLLDVQASIVLGLAALSLPGPARRWVAPVVAWMPVTTTLSGLAVLTG